MKQDNPSLILHARDHIFDPKNVTCVLVILFTPEQNILTIENKRGWDIPGGHIEIFDLDYEATARRELMEEAQALSGALKPCGILECYYTDKPSYMIIMTGHIEKLDEFQPSDEILSRSIMPVEKFLSVYKAAEPELMANMIDQAREALNYNQ